jgi:hypothetical protein
VSGDLERTLSGSAIFGVANDGANDQWIVYLPQSSASTFEVITIGPQGAATRLPTGTYDIVAATTADDGDVVGVYVSFRTGTPDIFGSAAGTLTITESSDDVVRGNFEFTAISLALDLTVEPDGQQVTVTGEFTAVSGAVPTLALP